MRSKWRAYSLGIKNLKFKSVLCRSGELGYTGELCQSVLSSKRVNRDEEWSVHSELWGRKNESTKENRISDGPTATVTWDISINNTNYDHHLQGDLKFETESTSYSIKAEQEKKRRHLQDIHRRQVLLCMSSCHRQALNMWPDPS